MKDANGKATAAESANYPLLGALDWDEIETALSTLAGLWLERVSDDDYDLTERQKFVADKLATAKEAEFED